MSVASHITRISSFTVLRGSSFPLKWFLTLQFAKCIIEMHRHLSFFDSKIISLCISRVYFENKYYNETYSPSAPSYRKNRFKYSFSGMTVGVVSHNSVKWGSQFLWNRESGKNYDPVCMLKINWYLHYSRKSPSEN